ncbi:MAG TPA: phage holin family protein [Alphaproteobacteria bacterium]|nr:phage holin family protein [Alphaproteobacteria bacterium]
MAIDNDPIHGHAGHGQGGAHLGASSAREQAPLTTLLGQLMDGFRDLFRGEIALAKAEMSEKVSRLGTSAAAVAVGGILLLAGLLVLLDAVVWAIAEFVDHWVAALVVGLAVLGIGYMVLRTGLKSFQAGNLVPNRTVGSIKEDVRFAREQVRDQVRSR